MKKNSFLLIISIFFISLSFGQEQRATLKSGQAPFFHGVASGDPLSDQVIIWTRVTPPTGNNNPIPVYWQIATDLNFTNIVNFGNTEALDSNDFTVKLDVCGLQPATYYYYVFHALGQNSVIGRTKTAPAVGGTEAKFAVASCSSYEHGYFNAYESMSKRNDLDAIIHLGDYIYEYESGGFSSSVVTGQGRVYEPTHEIITLSDYRIRHSHYKLDDQLQRLHQVHPFITTWDDHETANDSYKDGAQNHNSGEGLWIDRKISGTQAYKEYMPIRNPDPLDDVKIWRKLRYGELLDLIVLDSRLWGRDEQDLGETNNSNHNLLGNDQFTWLETQLLDSTTQWKIICQQVMMAPLEILGLPVNADQWDGYNAERNRLVDFIENNNVENPVILTGDIHTSWVNNVPGNSTNTAAVEYVVTSVTSPGLDVIETALGQLPQWLLNLFGGTVTGVVTGLNPHMEYVNVEDHGYLVLTVNQNRAQADYIWLERESLDTTDELGPSYYTVDGVSNIQSTSMPMPPTAVAAPFPPVNAVQNIPFAMLLDTFEIQVNENQLYNNCLINVSNPCPNLTTSIVDNPLYGSANVNQFCMDYTPITNYYGTDYMTVVFCQTANPNICDTSVVAITVIPDENTDTLFYQIDADSLLSDCITFDDLVGNPGSLVVQNSLDTFEIDTNTLCFDFYLGANFNGVHYISITTCDSLAVCDTVVLEITIEGTGSTTVVELFGEPNDLMNNCLGFDDLQGNLVSNGLVYTGSNNVTIYNDTCISYLSASNFEGTDTVLIYGCDNSQPPLCDTIEYWITIEMDSVVDTTNIKDVLNTDFAVIGIYPNPFDVEIIVQYYQFSSENIYITLYDMNGKVIFNDNINEVNSGLKYARLKTDNLASGTYIVELTTKQFTYTETIVKH